MMSLEPRLDKMSVFSPELLDFFSSKRPSTYTKVSLFFFYSIPPSSFFVTFLPFMFIWIFVWDSTHPLIWQWSRGPQQRINYLCSRQGWRVIWSNTEDLVQRMPRKPGGKVTHTIKILIDLTNRCRWYEHLSPFPFSIIFFPRRL